MNQQVCHRVGVLISQNFDWFNSHVPKNAEAVFTGGNGFFAIGVVKAL